MPPVTSLAPAVKPAPALLRLECCDLGRIAAGRGLIAAPAPPLGYFNKGIGRLESVYGTGWEADDRQGYRGQWD
jgi:hypothetical protein